jgi:SAM-dependent methyltransferase
MRESIRAEEQVTSTLLLKATMTKRALGRLRHIWTLADALSPMPWCVDHVAIVDDHLEVQGWAFAPDLDTSRGTFLLDGAPFAHIKYPMVRPDIERVFWYVPGAAQSGFSCRTPLARLEDDILKPYVLTYADRKTGRPVNPLHDYYFYRVPADDLPLPPAAHRRRVSGNEYETSFRVEGYTNFMKLRKALQDRLGRDYDSFKSILDWGCGCGRMTRYFRWVPATRVTGIDIDPDNVAWCDANLPFATFKATPLHPPSPLGDGQFDLLIGISVFTHLLEPETHEWLRELGRIAAPGAILLMTVHGKATAARSDLPEYVWHALKRTGIADGGPNPDLESSISVQHYYRNTFFSDEYIKRQWARYFDILDVVPGYVGNHQDLVIMRKR